MSKCNVTRQATKISYMCSVHVHVQQKKSTHSVLKRLIFVSLDELVDWDPWQPAAAAAAAGTSSSAMMENGEEDAPHCDDPNFNVRPHSLFVSHDLFKISTVLCIVLIR